MTVVAVVVDSATAVVAAVAEIAADSAAIAADSVEVAAVSAPPVGKCSTRFALNVARKRKFPSSPADLAQFIAGIASRPIARHVVAAVAAVAADMTAVVAVAATAGPAVTSIEY